MPHDPRLTEFINMTGADPSLAKEIMQAQQWNVESAVKTYRFMKNATLPPAGPQKNQEPKWVNMPPTSSTLTGGGVSNSNPPQHPGGGTTNTSTTIPGSPASTTERKLKRGISKTCENLPLVNSARDVVLHDITEDREANGPQFIDTPEYTFILPDITNPTYSEDFRAFLHKDLVEMSTLVSLEQVGRLNWWADMGACQRLLPLATTGDGNCLLHAASLGMWGFHDRLLTLRKALYQTLTNGVTQGALWRRWRLHQANVNKQSGLVYSEAEWQKEWENLTRLASTKPRTNPGRPGSCCDSAATRGLMERTVEREGEVENSDVFYESLEEFHVFVLAHILRRPVIVVADTVLKNSSGEALAPIPFSGIYLPLECQMEECHRSPLILTYDASHFSALVPMDSQRNTADKKLPAAIPLVDPDFKLLPIHFMVDPGPQFNWKDMDTDSEKAKNLALSMDDKLNLIKQYLDIEQVPIPGSMENNLDVESESRGRSSSFSGMRSLSRTGSIESDEGVGKEKDKSRLQTVAKSFGSLGKSMSKKLKKNFGGIGKAMKVAEIERQKKSSVGSVTQSTKVGLTPELLKDRYHILCAKLLHKRAAYQEEMVKNYLDAAQERFQQNRQIRRQQDQEMKQKVEMKRSLEVDISGHSLKCITQECENIGNVATSYLCPECFARQKQQVLDLQKTSHTEPNLERQNTLMVTGKSKFYTYAHEQHIKPDGTRPPPPYPGHSTAVANTNLNNVCVAKDDKVGDKPVLKLARSSFYEGVQSAFEKQPPTANNKSGAMPSSCVLNNMTHLRDKDKQIMNLPPISRTAFINDIKEPPIREEFKNVLQNHTSTVSVNHKTGVDTTDLEYKFNQHVNLNPTTVRLPNHNSTGQAGVNAKPHVTRIQVKEDPDYDNIPNTNYKKNCRCLNGDCSFFGSEETEYYCSACFNQRKRTLAHMAQRQTKL